MIPGRLAEVGAGVLREGVLRGAETEGLQSGSCQKTIGANATQRNLTSTSCGGVFSAGGAWGRRKSRGMRRRRKRQISELFYAPSLEK